MARLIPEIVAERDIAHGVFPPTDNFEILVHVQIAAGRLPSSVAQKRNYDLGAETVDRVRTRQVGLSLDLVALDNFMQTRCARIGLGVDDIDIVGAYARDQQVLARH